MGRMGRIGRVLLRLRAALATGIACIVRIAGVVRDAAIAVVADLVAQAKNARLERALELVAGLIAGGAVAGVLLAQAGNASLQRRLQRVGGL
jgi:hypothetical protein